jgi:hypothetical protein
MSHLMGCKFAWLSLERDKLHKTRLEREVVTKIVEPKLTYRRVALLADKELADPTESAASIGPPLTRSGMLRWTV